MFVCIVCCLIWFWTRNFFFLGIGGGCRWVGHFFVTFAIAPLANVVVVAGVLLGNKLLVIFHNLCYMTKEMKKKEQELSIFPSKSSAKKAEATARRMGNFTNKILENLVRAWLPQYVFEPSMLVVLLFDLLLQSESIFSIANIALLIHGCEAAGRKKKKKKRKFVNQGRDHTQITPKKKRGNSSRELMKSSRAKKSLQQVTRCRATSRMMGQRRFLTVFGGDWGLAKSR